MSNPLDQEMHNYVTLANSPASDRTLLQEYAGLAMQGLVAGNLADFAAAGTGVINYKAIAENALEIAQAMIEAQAN